MRLVRSRMAASADAPTAIQVVISHVDKALLPSPAATRARVLLSLL
jgi:hypothetical protein